MKTRYVLAILVYFLFTLPIAGQKKSSARYGKEYFPPGVFAAGYSDGSGASDWFAGHLHALGEPPLLHNSPNNEIVYRFILLPSFSKAISVRVAIHSDGTGTVVTKIGTGLGGYAPKKIADQQSHQLSKEAVASFQELIAREKFWEQPSEPSKPDNGCDGTEWVMEGRSDHYHVVDRWEGGSLQQIGEYILTKLGHVARDGHFDEGPAQHG